MEMHDIAIACRQGFGEQGDISYIDVYGGKGTMRGACGMVHDTRLKSGPLCAGARCSVGGEAGQHS